jgi:hypothetical protein
LTNKKKFDALQTSVPCNSSNFFQSNVGVRQGEILYPVLFAIFLNDLVEFMSHAYNGIVDMSTAARLLDTDEVAITTFVLDIFTCSFQV